MLIHPALGDINSHNNHNHSHSHNNNNNKTHHHASQSPPHHHRHMYKFPATKHHITRPSLFSSHLDSTQPTTNPASIPSPLGTQHSRAQAQHHARVRILRPHAHGWSTGPAHAKAPRRTPTQLLILCAATSTSTSFDLHMSASDTTHPTTPSPSSLPEQHTTQHRTAQHSTAQHSALDAKQAHPSLPKPAATAPPVMQMQPLYAQLSPFQETPPA
jgi:hypothetical protein